MKKIAIISTLILTTAVVFISCDSKRQPGKVYMPDMAYSRAYESYALRDSTKFSMDLSDAGHKIFYNNQPVNGTIVLNPNGTVTYTPNPNFHGIDVFTYTICDVTTIDPHPLCSQANVYINVTPVNNPPVANTDVVTTSVNTTVKVTVQSNDNDPDNNPLITKAVVTTPAHGTTVINPNGTDRKSVV